MSGKVVFHNSQSGDLGVTGIHDKTYSCPHLAGKGIDDVLRYAPCEAPSCHRHVHSRLAGGDGFFAALGLGQPSIELAIQVVLVGRNREQTAF